MTQGLEVLVVVARIRCFNVGRGWGVRVHVLAALMKKDDIVFPVLPGMIFDSSGRVARKFTPPTGVTVPEGAGAIECDGLSHQTGVIRYNCSADAFSTLSASPNDIKSIKVVNSSKMANYRLLGRAPFFTGVNFSTPRFGAPQDF